MTPRDEREIVRRALERATTDVEPSLDRLVDAVPAILAAAERRRSAGAPLAVAPVARTWLPRLAAAAIALAAAAWLWPNGSSTTASGLDDGAVLDGWIVTGKAEASVTDPVMDALVRNEEP